MLDRGPVTIRFGDDARDSLGSTYSDIEFNSTPENQHGRVSVAKGDPVDLGESEDGANCRE